MKTSSLLSGHISAPDFLSMLSGNVQPPAWCNPKPDGIYDIVVIGAGSGGLAAAREAARLGVKVALIERGMIGGSCLNVGSIPSKTIIRSARLFAEMRNAGKVGGEPPADLRIDFSRIVERMRNVQARLSSAISAPRLTEAGIDVYFGEARFASTGTVVVAGEVLSFKKALIATGARPLAPSIPGIETAGYLTNENVFDLTECPGRLLVMGGGPLGCELAQAFSRLGSHVIIIQEDPTFLPAEERDAARVLSDALVRDGIEIHLNTTVSAVRTRGADKVVDLISDGAKTTVFVDHILAGIGRLPNVQELNLEAATVRYDTVKGIYVDDFLRTSNARVYAVGDVCLEQKYTHAAEASAHVAVKNALQHGRDRLSALIIPWCTYTDPEIAHVGIHVQETWKKTTPVRTFTVPMHDVDRAITDGEEEGYVKIHVKQGCDRIVGATVVARDAGEIINGLSLAISAGIGLRAVARVIHTYPTQAEAIKLAASAYNTSPVTSTRRETLVRSL